MKKYIIGYLISIFLLFGLEAPAYGSLTAELEWQYTNERSSCSLKSSYWFSDRLGISGSYGLQDHCLSAAVYYKANPVFKGSTTYIGLGVRDLNDSYNSGLRAEQKIELTFGAEYSMKRFVPGLSISVDARLIPNELFGNISSNGFAPILGFAVGYEFPGHRTSGPTTLDIPSDSDIYLLARLITAEAGDEPYDGQVAVGAVVLNRTKSGEFPATIREVIYQPGQFSSLPKLPAVIPTQSCIKAAQEALNGADPSRGALYFYNPATCSEEGLRFFTTANLRVTVRIGNHVFLK